MLRKLSVVLTAMLMCVFLCGCEQSTSSGPEEHPAGEQPKGEQATEEHPTGTKTTEEHPTGTKTTEEHPTAEHSTSEHPE